MQIVSLAPTTTRHDEPTFSDEKLPLWARVLFQCIIGFDQWNNATETAGAIATDTWVPRRRRQDAEAAMRRGKWSATAAEESRAVRAGLRGDTYSILLVF